MPKREERDLVVVDLRAKRFSRGMRGEEKREYGIEFLVINIKTKRKYLLQRTNQELMEWIQEILSWGSEELLPKEISDL